MPKGKIHVVPYDGGWAAKREGASRPGKIYNTKAEAIEAARKMAWRADEGVTLHGKKGKITKGKRYGKNPDDENCFITTACVRHFKLQDNCYQLSTLRKFRDTYLKNCDDGNVLIKQYYSVAPQLVTHLNQHPNKNKLFKNIFQQINFACALIEEKRNEEAKKLYVNIVSQLLKLFKVA